MIKGYLPPASGFLLPETGILSDGTLIVIQEGIAFSLQDVGKLRPVRWQNYFGWCACKKLKSGVWSSIHPVDTQYNTEAVKLLIPSMDFQHFYRIDGGV